MDILIGILTVVEVLVCLLLILVVLMQRPRQEGLGASFGDGMMSQIAGAQTTNVLQKFTVYLAVALFILTLSLAMLVTRKQSSRANTQLFSAPAPAAVEAPKVEEKPATPAPATPAPAEAPKSGEAKPAVETSPPTKPLQEAVKKEAAPVAAPAEKPATPPAAPAKPEEPKPAAAAAPTPAPAPAAVTPTPAPAPAPATTPAPGPAPTVPAAPAAKP